MSYQKYTNMLGVQCSIEYTNMSVIYKYIIYHKNVDVKYNHGRDNLTFICFSVDKLRESLLMKIYDD